MISTATLPVWPKVCENVCVPVELPKPVAALKSPSRATTSSTVASTCVVSVGPLTTPSSSTGLIVTSTIASVGFDASLLLRKS